MKVKQFAFRWNSTDQNRGANNMITAGVDMGGRRNNGADLTGGAVGEAGFVVCSKVKICGTGTFVFPTRGKKT